MRVELVYALPDRAWRVKVEVADNACVADALDQGLPALRTACGSVEVEADPSRLAVFGRPAAAESLLHDGDRIEILRPLLADPKQARRRRAVQSRGR
ncbi:MAG TPA: RnfH family protein [Arenimonas sp.]|nr:RnfH family protein [Arenimonas sp.]